MRTSWDLAGHILTFQFYTAIIPPMKDKGVLIQAGT